MKILDRINSSRDVKLLTDEELQSLAAEMRMFLVDTVSKTGGHLASNLGAVELTLALHRVYDTERDRLVFDVGHQSYVHKIITGRRDRFETLRQYEGLSGFPKPHESVDDAVIAGHASNSVSVAVGMAKARTLLGENYDVVAVLGDGAMTGGLAYEGLAAAASSKEPIVIILNDNNMSIDQNVGGTARLLQSMRIRPGYLRFKRLYRDVFSAVPAVYSFNHEVKEKLKDKLLPVNTFSAMGLNYLGPVDGHDIRELENVIRLAKEMEEPVLVHVLTRKGKGVSYAEEHPDIYHGVSPFNPFTGELFPTGRCFSDCAGEVLTELAGEKENLFAVTAAMSIGTGLDSFAKKYPKRFWDVGIAEGHATSMAAGMAKQGLVPVFAVYSSFLQRGYDMLIHDVSLQNLHVVFCVDRAGIVGSDGETHHGIFDVSYLRTVPGMSICCPASFAELAAMLREAICRMDGPVAVRYPRGGECGYSGLHPEKEALLRDGTDLTLVAYGTMICEALRAANMLAEQGISAEVIKLGEIGGSSYPMVMTSLRKTGRLLAAEEVIATGCIGTVLSTAAAENGIPVKAALLNLGEGIVVHGGRAQLMHDYGIDALSVAERGRALCAPEQHE